MQQDTFLNQLSRLVTQFVAADGFFADVPVHEEQLGLVEAQIIQDLSTLNVKSGKRGAIVIVRQPFVDSNESESPMGDLRVLLEVDCVEEPLFNTGAGGTGKSAAAIWTNVFRLLSGWRIDLLGVQLSVDKKPGLADGNNDGQVRQTLRLRCPYRVDYVERCHLSGLEIEQVSGTTHRVRATTTTTGASCYFAITPAAQLARLPNTTDDTPVASGQWHTFTAAASVTVMAMAYATDKLGSPALAARYNVV
jgi:hypothetical protein